MTPLSQFSKKPPSIISDHSWYLQGFSSSIARRWCLITWPIFTTIVQPESPWALRFPLSKFPTTDCPPHLRSPLSYKFPIRVQKWAWIHSETSVAILLNRACFYCLKFCPALLFPWTLTWGLIGTKKVCQERVRRMRNNTYSSKWLPFFPSNKNYKFLSSCNLVISNKFYSL